ncbi:hypothetical protein E4L96_19015 [Massilia arenosa]|uniref:Type IV secretion protein Rhs n=1 Tax=Zemynaea arenosa TaxID=2561931 RepID=A0A4Y9RXS8_9BURK|nr:hypothetical protein [Massilia arenosa]TFW13864.1 hypothetical protein E4L96_19015 [Massilia arenosa]
MPGHVSTTACDALWELIFKYKATFGDRFDQIPIGIGPDHQFYTGARIKNAKNGCEAHHLLGESSMCTCYACDEQLRFTNLAGIPLSNTHYRLHLADGSIHEGITDAEGRTLRVGTQEETEIQQVELIQPEELMCCARSREPRRVIRFLDEVRTTRSQYGTSVWELPLEPRARYLTPGEIKMASSIFKFSIDYSLVRVHDEEYLWFGMQPDNAAITPDGQIYVGQDSYRPDYSTCPEYYLRRLFMHEMMHVWQYQMGYWVKLRGAVRIGLDYSYELGTHRDLSEYNMEAQGDILADYFALMNLGSDYIAELRYRGHADKSLYLCVVGPFLDDPCNSKFLASLI